jgi:hypothetical protein
MLLDLVNNKYVHKYYVSYIPLWCSTNVFLFLKSMEKTSFRQLYLIIWLQVFA